MSVVTPDVATIGEALLRLWVPTGERLEDTGRLRLAVAGAEANVAVGVARMGRTVSWISRLPTGPLGRRVTSFLSGHGVDVSGVTRVPGGRMGTYYIEMNAAPLPINVMYDRAGSTAAGMTAGDVNWDIVSAASVVHLTGITPALSESCLEITREAVRRAHRAGATVTFDVNYRKRLWSADEASPVMSELAALADVVVLTVEDASDLFGCGGDANDVLDGLRTTLATGAIVVTLGGDGAAWDAGGERGAAPGYEVDAVDRVGAGDAFAAGVVLGVLDGDLASGVRTGLAMAAIKLGTYGDQFLAGPEEVQSLLGGRGREVSR